MPRGPVQILAELPSLGFALAVRIHGLAPEIQQALTARWPGHPDAAPPGAAELTLTAAPGPVGLPSSDLVTAEIAWRGPARAELRTNAAAFSLTLDPHPDGALRGHGQLDALRARGAVEAAIRAVTTLALARRGVLLLHAAAVHRAGDAIVLLGASGAGKTTSARRLGREGLQRIADDLIAVDLAASPPTLHRLPFERAGRARPGPAGERITCRGGARVQKGAPAARLAALPDAARVWADAVVALPPAPGAQPALLAAVARLCALPLRLLEAPPAGPLAPAILPWVEELRSLPPPRPPPASPLDASPPTPQATRPGAPGSTMADREDADRIARAPNVAWRVLDGAAVLVAPSSPAIQTLNEVGTLLWQLADGRPIADLVDAVVNEFEVERTQASADVERFVDDLVARGLLVAGPRPGAG
jgi:hypothetical protein